MNTTPVWDLGFSGKDVLVSCIDDGLYFEAHDLKDAFVRHCVISISTGLFLFLTPSFVLGCRELLRLQRPRQAHGARDHHGTRCSGKVAARENVACGVGIAYDSKSAGIHILGGRITTTDEATVAYCAHLWLRQGWRL